HGLAELPRLLCLSKRDLVPGERIADAIDEWRERGGGDVLATSAATGAGLEELAAAITWRVPLEDALNDGPPGEIPATHRVYRPGEADQITVERTPSGAYAVHGERVERLMARHDPNNDEAMRYVEGRLR